MVNIPRQFQLYLRLYVSNHKQPWTPCVPDFITKAKTCHWLENTRKFDKINIKELSLQALNDRKNIDEVKEYWKNHWK
jgi:hypothetical protein